MGYWPSVKPRILAKLVFLRVYGPRWSRDNIINPFYWPKKLDQLKDLRKGMRTPFSCRIQRVIPSGQDESNPAMWLATSYLARSGLSAMSRKKNLSETQIKILYWLSFFGEDGWILASFFDFMRVYGLRRNTHKKTLANIQPSWPHTWSITHISISHISSSSQSRCSTWFILPAQS